MLLKESLNCILFFRVFLFNPQGSLLDEHLSTYSCQLKNKKQKTFLTNESGHRAINRDFRASLSERMLTQFSSLSFSDSSAFLLQSVIFGKRPQVQECYSGSWAISTTRRLTLTLEDAAFPRPWFPLSLLSVCDCLPESILLSLKYPDIWCCCSSFFPPECITHYQAIPTLP